MPGFNFVIPPPITAKHRPKDFLLALGGGNEIGASAYWLSVNGVNLLFDAGMRFDAQRAFPDFSPLFTRLGGLPLLDGYFLTHAHLDHCGAVAMLCHEAPSLPKFATPATLALAGVMLRDAVTVKKNQHREDWGINTSPMHEVEGALASFSNIEFGQTVQLKKDVHITAIPAGHILGAASYLIEAGGKRILLSGDICLHAQRLVPGADLSGIGTVDTLILESTYAFQPAMHQESIVEQQYHLVQAVSEFVNAGGKVLIPSFALGRAQEIAAIFSDTFHQGLASPYPIIMDGLVRSICDIYNTFRPLLMSNAQTRPGHAIYSEYVQPTPQNYYPTLSEIERLGPCCVIASSGMLLDGTRSSRYAQIFAPNPHNGIFFSGYIDDETPGKRLLHQSSTSVMINRERIVSKADIRRYHLSAHSSSQELRSLIELLHPTNLILIHGEYSYRGDPDFIQFMINQEKQGAHIYQSANGVPIYL
jgi:Cft2 family RNA processing exonuclease